MSDLTTVFLLSLLPAFGNVVGGLFAEWLPPSKKALNRALHAAAGIILAIVAIEVMPEAMKRAPPLLLAVMFVAGGFLYIAVDAAINRYLSETAGPWMVYVAVAADLFGDGLMIGSGSAVSTSLAFVLALGQVLADLPEGFAVASIFRDRGMKPFKRRLLTASLALPVILAALLSYFVLRGQSEVTKMAGLVFVAGLFSLAAIEDMLGEAHETEEDTHWSSISFLAGFALFMIVSGYFG